MSLHFDWTFKLPALLVYFSNLRLNYLEKKKKFVDSKRNYPFQFWFIDVRAKSHISQICWTATCITRKWLILNWFFRECCTNCKVGWSDNAWHHWHYKWWRWWSHSQAWYFSRCSSLDEWSRDKPGSFSEFTITFHYLKHTRASFDNSTLKCANSIPKEERHFTAQWNIFKSPVFGSNRLCRGRRGWKSVAKWSK